MTAAVLLAAVAAAVATGASRRLPEARPRSRGGRRVQWPTVLAGALAAMAVTVAGPRWAGWTLAVLVVAGAVVHLVAERRRRRAREAAAADVAAAARVMAGLLRAGQLPSEALAHAARDHPALRPAAAAAELGADVAAHLDAAGGRPGCAGLRAMASAWSLSERTGAPIADLLAVVADALRQQRRLAALIETELAAARASGRIMGALPIAAALLGALAGVDTVAVLVGQTWGQWLVCGGVVLAVVGVLWVERLAAEPGGASS